MQVSVIRPGELGEAELTRWRAIQEADPAFDNPFLSPEFTLTVGELRDHVEVAVLEDGSDVVGFFPFERRSFGVGKPVAAGLTDAQGLVLAKDVKLDPRWLIKQCGLVVYEFDHLVDGQPLAAYGHLGRYPSPIIDMRHGYQAYIETIKETSGKTYRSTLYKARKLQRDIGPLHHDFATTSAEALRTLLGWKTDQYRRTGRSDRFAHQWIVELVERLQATRSASFAGVLDMMYVDGRPMAGHFGLRTRTTLVGWFPAYDISFSKYSPGLVQHLAMAERSSEAGIVVIDLGRGEKEYKDKLKNGEFAVVEGRVATAGPRAAVHWMMLIPARKARAAVIADPRLHRIADRTLKMYGSLRTKRRDMTSAG
jgi:CelD/BcsL family acetyltransferase involved in cellulose biosynthesis